MIAMFSLCVLNHTIYLKKTARCNEPGGFNSRNDLHNPKSRIVSGDSPPLCVSNLTFYLKIRSVSFHGTGRFILRVRSPDRQCETGGLVLLSGELKPPDRSLVSALRIESHIFSKKTARYRFMVPGGNFIYVEATIGRPETAKKSRTHMSAA